MRRFVMLAFSLTLSLGLCVVGSFAQDSAKKDAQTKKDDVKASPAEKKDGSAKKEGDKKDSDKKDSEKTAAASASSSAPPAIPKEVEAKLTAARKAVAEAVAAAEAAGLVQTSIDPPPILDILVQGYADDEKIVTGTGPKWVTPEVFCAWFTGFGKSDLKNKVNYESDVRIVQPSKGLTTYYERRKSVFEPYLIEARKAAGVQTKTPDKKEADKKDADKKEADKKDADKKDADKKDADKKTEGDKKEADKKEADKKEADPKK